MSAAAVFDGYDEFDQRPADERPSRQARPQGAFPWQRVDADERAGHAGAGVRTRSRDTAPRRNDRPRDAVYLPPGWPAGVRPPETPDWEQSAVAFLLDCCPADYRAHVVLRRHPVVLASLAGQFIESQIRASREALGQTRAGLGDYVTTDVLDDTIGVLQSEEARLVRVRRSVALVEEALRGRVFIRKL